MVAVEPLIVFSALLFGIGILAALLRRSLIAVVIGIQLMLAAGNLALLGFIRIWIGAGDAAADAQAFVFIVIAVAIAQIAMGVGILIAFHRHRDSLSIEDVKLLRW